jgi:hypothetical protein
MSTPIFVMYGVGQYPWDPSPTIPTIPWVPAPVTPCAPCPYCRRIWTSSTTSIVTTKPREQVVLESVRGQLVALLDGAKSRKKRKAFREALEIVDSHLGELV